MLTHFAWFQIVKVVPNSKRLEELILNSACAIIYALHFFKSYSWCVKTAVNFMGIVLDCRNQSNFVTTDIKNR